MSLEFTFRPITLWPHGGDPATTPNDYRRSRWSFKAGYNDTLHLLRRELEQLGARGPVVVQLALKEAHIRLDGLPRADAPRPAHPGVIVSFESRHGPLQYATDEFELWEHNLRAIALGLEALRKVDRYGITRSGEQYAGWKALPSGARQADAARGRVLIREHGTLSDALKATHPDHGGDPDDFRDVQAVVEQYGSVAKAARALVGAA